MLPLIIRSPEPGKPLAIRPNYRRRHLKLLSLSEKAAYQFSYHVRLAITLSGRCFFLALVMVSRPKEPRSCDAMACFIS
jgi:hypothetical protein